MNNIKIAAIIPSRMASSRLPGKPLIKINNLQMIEHVRRRALLCKYFDDVIVATCDREIANVVYRNKGKVIMTSRKHIDCNERILEASKKINASHIVNVQGDEVLILPKYLEKICKMIKQNPKISYWNAVSDIENKIELINDTIVKCYLSNNGNIIFCSRYENYIRDTVNKMPIKKLLGIQAFRKEQLNIYQRKNITYLEKKFSIGQMRIIENNYYLKSIQIDKGYRGVDKLRDLRYVKKILSTEILQKKVVQKIIN